MVVKDKIMNWINSWQEGNKKEKYNIEIRLGTFIEGKYNKYWNREWYDFKCGINYVIF